MSAKMTFLLLCISVEATKKALQRSRWIPYRKPRLDASRSTTLYSGVASKNDPLLLIGQLLLLSEPAIKRHLMGELIGDPVIVIHVLLLHLLIIILLLLLAVIVDLLVLHHLLLNEHILLHLLLLVPIIVVVLVWFLLVQV